MQGLNRDADKALRPRPYETMIPFWNATHARQVMLKCWFLLPHEVLECSYRPDHNIYWFFAVPPMQNRDHFRRQNNCQTMQPTEHLLLTYVGSSTVYRRPTCSWPTWARARCRPRIRNPPDEFSFGDFRPHSGNILTQINVHGNLHDDN